VEVTGTPEFPKNQGNTFYKSSWKAMGGIGIIEKKEYIKDRVIMTVITGGGFHVVN
jgi:hypothetical protein